MRPKAKMRHATRHDARLQDLARAQLDPGPDAEVIVLAAPGAQSLELYARGQILVAAVVSQEANIAVRIRNKEILVAVIVDVGDGERCASHHVHRCGQQVRPILEPAVIVVKEKYAWTCRSLRDRRARDDEIEPAVIVVVDELCGGSAQ